VVLKTWNILRGVTDYKRILELHLAGKSGLSIFRIAELLKDSSLEEFD
jgi:hypothetical protein